MFRYHDKRASSYCRLPKPLCNSKTKETYKMMKSFISYVAFYLNYMRLMYIVQDYHIIKKFRELNQSDIQFPMIMREIPTFELLNILNNENFGLSSSNSPSL